MTLRKIAGIGGIGLSLILLGACTTDNPNAGFDGNDDRQPDAPDPVVSTTSRVLETARTENDTGEPFTVNDGAFSFNDTSEFTDPVSINR